MEEKQLFCECGDEDCTGCMIESRAFSIEQSDYIARQEKQCVENCCDDNGHKHD